MAKKKPIVNSNLNFSFDIILTIFAFTTITAGERHARAIQGPVRPSITTRGLGGAFLFSLQLPPTKLPHQHLNCPFCVAIIPVAIMSSTVTATEQPEITAENVVRLFPEVNTTVIGGSHDSARNDDALAGYDEEQIKLMDEVCIVLDNDDKPIGSASKKVCK